VDHPFLEGLMTKLWISPDLPLPKDVVTSTQVVFGGKGMGKTNFGSVLVEEMTKVGLRWCVLDGLGVWWGLRHSADGKGSGIECLILGGVHGDIPIEPTGGTVVADLVVDEDVDVVVDFSRKPSGQMWSKGEKMSFLTAFALRLFQRQGELVSGRRRPPLSVILDEAARYIPQMVRSGDKDAALSVGAWEDLAEEGRNVGIGVVFLTQRSARINKSVSELADAMYAFRTVGPLSLGAITDWLGEHVPKGRIAELAETVRSLPVGSALVVSPGWLRFEGVVRIRSRETFDSSSTPKPGQQQRRVTGRAAMPDLTKYRERMAETIERSEADDPRNLKRVVADLRKQLSQRQVSKPEVITKEVEVRVPALDTKALEAVVTELDDIVREVHEGSELSKEVVTVLERFIREQIDHERQRSERERRLIKRLDRLSRALEKLARDGTIPSRVTVQKRAGKAAASQASSRPGLRSTSPEENSTSGAPRVGGGVARPAASPSSTDGSGISRPQQRILDSLAWFLSVGISVVRRSPLAAVSGVSSKSSGYEKNVSTLKTMGLISYPERGSVGLTESGKELANFPDSPATNEELQRSIYGMVSKPQARLLQILVSMYPDGVDRERLAEMAGVSEVSSGYEKNISTLKSFELVYYPQRGWVAALPIMFIEEPV
jgi:uncharacterized protein